MGNKLAMQVVRMAGPGSDKIRAERLTGPQKQGMFCQATSRLLAEFIGPAVKPIPTRIDVLVQTDPDGYQYVLLVPHFERRAD